MPKVLNINQQGFTVVEMMVGVVVLGLLASFAYTTINPNSVKKRSEDSIRLSNIQKLVEGLESYHFMEKSLPVDSNSDGNPYNDIVNTEIGKYIGSWPDGRPQTSDHYIYSLNAATGNFGLIVGKSDLRFYKYRSETSWGKRVRECGPTTVVGDLACP